MIESIENIIAIKLTGGDFTPEEQLYFDQWISVPGNQTIYNEYLKIWNVSANVENNIIVDIDEEWQNFKLNRQVKSNKFFIKPVYRWVSGVAAVIVLAVGLFALLSTPKNITTSYASINGNEKIMLPDQSEVWLNRNTTLTYCQNNQLKQREIELNGEAIFKVVKNGQPFIIHTRQNVDTKVLGTEFNLRAYSSDDFILLSVITGKVAFGNEKSNVIVTKGQQVEYLCGQNELSEIKPIDENMLGWKTGIFVFNNEPLTKVAEQIGNYIDKAIELPTGSDNLQYSGSFTEPTAEDFAQIISVALNWNYTITDQKITFNKK